MLSLCSLDDFKNDKIVAINKLVTVTFLSNE